jgi:hypothetical protein
LRGGRFVPDRTLFWRTRAQDATRRGPWKLWRGAGQEALFNIPSDPSERANLLAYKADVAASLRQAFAEWDATVLPRPTTPQRGRGPGHD